MGGQAGEENVGDFSLAPGGCLGDDSFIDDLYFADPILADCLTAGS